MLIWWKLAVLWEIFYSRKLVSLQLYCWVDSEFASMHSTQESLTWFVCCMLISCHEPTIVVMFFLTTSLLTTAHQLPAYSPPSIITTKLVVDPCVSRSQGTQWKSGQFHTSGCSHHAGPIMTLSHKHYGVESISKSSNFHNLWKHLKDWPLRCWGPFPPATLRASLLEPSQPGLGTAPSRVGRLSLHAVLCMVMYVMCNIWIWNFTFPPGFSVGLIGQNEHSKCTWLLTKITDPRLVSFHVKSKFYHSDIEYRRLFNYESIQKKEVNQTCWGFIYLFIFFALQAAFLFGCRCNLLMWERFCKEMIQGKKRYTKCFTLMSISLFNYSICSLKSN